MVWLYGGLAVMGSVAATATAIASLRENETRAAKVAVTLGICGVATLLTLALSPIPVWLDALFVAGLLALAVALSIPDRNLRPRAADRPAQRVDERETMFARRELRDGSDAHAAYYKQHPEHLAPDERWRAKPGLMSPTSRYQDRLAFAAADASFVAVEELHSLVDGDSAPDAAILDPADASTFVTGWVRKLGALDAGVTRLDPHHIYSTGGRRERRDRPIALDHPFAIAFTVEMDHAMMQAAPDAPTLMESAQQYLASGTIAVQMAVAIRRLGYRARAHIDANYQVICPLVARDAGLGEIGRMGLLMTPRQGPRVRIGVVTTDMPLHVVPRVPDATVEDFCLHCRKCATVCPSQAISFGDVEDHDGTRHWKIDAEACFTYWCEAGTDCGRCMATCPYSHPDSMLHNLVRAGIGRSPLFRRGAVWMDDLFYGRKPRPRQKPDWLPAHKK